MDHKPRILFYFLHLLGVGHVFRAQRLIDGFAKQGFAVDIIYGGHPLKDISFNADSIHYLPPIRAADSSFSGYLDANDQPLARPFQELRAQKLVQIIETLQPDIVLTEAFPFGRRMVRFEMQAMLEVMGKRHPKPLIVSSVRDILQERKKPGRMEETCQWIDRYFDHVLVHSDPSVIQLDATFPLADHIANKISYSGFVIASGGTEPVKEQYDVVVSAGGGAFGGDLIATGLEAARHLRQYKWCVSTGPNLDEEKYQQVVSTAPDHVEVTRYLPNLAEQMKHASLSISQCGYNTAMDVLAAHRDSPCRAVFIPYDTEGQSEQLRRAEILQQAGYAVCLPQSQLTTEALVKAVGQALNLPRIDHAVDFDGVDNSANLLRSWLEKR